MEKVSLDISREEELLKTVRSFPVLYDKPHKSFKEKDLVKNAWNGVATTLEFIQTGNYFCLALLLHFLKKCIHLIHLA